MENNVMQIRIDSDLKEKASKLFKDLGIDTSTAVRLFFRKSLSVSNIPFEIVNKSEKNENNKISRKYTVDDFKKYMCDEESLYKDVSVDDYIKEMRSDRNF